MEKGLLTRITDFSIGSYRMIYLGMVLITLWGLMIYGTLPRESKPEVVFPTIRIATVFPGAGPSDVELLVTNKLEAALLQVEGLEFISSTSSAGRSDIQLDFLPDGDPDGYYNDVLKAVSSVRDLPDEAQEPLIKMASTANRAFLVLSVSGDVSPREIRDQVILLENRLSSVDGIRDIGISGLGKEEIQVLYHPLRLAEFGLTASDVLQALRLRHKDTPAGSAELDGTLYYVRVLGSYRDMEEIRRTPVPLPSGGSRFLKDLAQVELTQAPPESISRRAVDLGTANARMLPAVTISLYRDGGSDIVGPSIEARKIVDDFSREETHNGLDVAVIQDDAQTVQQDLADVLGNAFSGLLVVILVLYLFLGFKEALITSLIIPFSMFLGFLGLDAAGMTFNTMTLLAMIISLGLLVDNAIVVVESIAEYRHKGHGKIAAAKMGTADVAPSIFAATLTTMAAFMPLAFMEGRIGMLVSVIPVTVLFIIGASLLIALTITPAMAARWFNAVTAEKADGFSKRRELFITVLVPVLFGYAFWIDGRPGVLSLVMTAVMAAFMAFRYRSRSRGSHSFAKIAEKYKNALTYLLAHSAARTALPLLLLLVLVLTGLGIYTGFLKIELFPVKDETTLYALITAPEYSTLAATDAITQKAEKVLMETDGIKSMYSEVGLTSPRDAQIVLNLLGPGERSWTTQEKIPELMKTLANIPGARITVGTQAGGKTVNSPVQIKLSSDDLEALKKAADNTAALLSEIGGLRGITTDWEQGYPEVHIVPDDLYASQTGSSAASIGAAVQSYLGSMEAGTMTHGGSETDIMLKVIDPMRDSLDDLDKILIPVKGGGIIPITYAASKTPTTGFGTIRHYQGRRTVSVMAQMLPDANIREIVRSAQSLFTTRPPMPDGVSYVWTGEAADLDASLNTMMFNLLAALLIVFLILVIQFNSFTKSLVIMLTVPMSMTGVFAGLLLTGNNFGLYAFMGVIALVGIVVNDAIVLVDTIGKLTARGKPLPEALAEAGSLRLGPVLATSLTTIGGILPLAFKDQNFTQFSVVLISGLTASTLLTLIILPLLYRLLDRVKNSIQHTIPVLIDDEKGVSHE
ncbi:MAG: efflux RND transporter permease subunit [Spirochaetales bacterium]|nr:efflux RND transporter permease subunit [Spirochaetales bacterium]